jgi:glycosyltransferase involved in cell wall biosynthesis
MKNQTLLNSGTETLAHQGIVDTQVSPKIIYIMSSFTVGGAEKQWASYLEHRPKDFVADIEVVVMLPTRAEHQWVENLYRNLGVKITLVDRSSLSFPKFFWKLYRTLKAAKPDLVFTVLTGSVGTWGRLAAWLAGVPHLIQADLTMMLEFTRSHQLLDPFLNRLTDIFLPNAHAIAERLQGQGVPGKKIFILPNITDTERFNPRRFTSLRSTWNIPEGATVAGFIARFRPEKRVDLLLEAMLLVPETERPDYLVLAGDGPTMPEVKRRVEGDPWLRDHCLLLGVLEDTPGFFASVDYTLLTSDSEGVPNVVLEAMAMEKPVIATKVSDVPHILKGAGFLSEMGDAAGLAENIRAMQALTPEQRHMLGERGRIKVIRNFSRAHSARVFWNIHRAVLNQETTQLQENASVTMEGVN